MTEEATSNPSTILTEVTVQSGAVLALTHNNAIFRNGRQLVIPHHGADFIPELMEALGSDEFVAATIANRTENPVVTGNEEAVEDCGHYSEDVMETCNAPEGHDGPHTYTNENGGVTAWHEHPTLEEIAALPDRLIEDKANLLASIEATPKEVCGHEHPAGIATCLDFAGHIGPHQGWQGGPADWGGGDDVNWEQEPEVTPAREIPENTTWEGFIIHHIGKATTADVYHPKSNKRIGFTNREVATGTLADPFVDAYDRLCATGYIEWFDIYFPGQEDWRGWEAGNALISDKGGRALVIPWEGTLAVINDEGTYFTLDERNADVFSHWTKSGR